MDDGNKITRRDMLGRSLLLGAVATVGTNLFLSACGSPALNCESTAGLSAEDIATRTSNQYVDRSMDATKKCSTCNFWLAAAPEACGGCTVVKGAINPAGNCRIWVAKQS